MDFLEHEVGVAALLGRFGVPLNLHRLLFDLLAVDVVKVDGAGRQLRHLQVADVVDGAGAVQDGRYVRGDVAAVPILADDERAVLAGDKEAVGEVAEHHGEGIGAADAQHGLGDGGERFAALLVVGVDQLDRRLGVGLGVEAVAGLGELFPDLLIVFDDAVVHQHHRQVVGAVRVGV